jgi:hypothetical protein
MPRSIEAMRLGLCVLLMGWSAAAPVRGDDLDDRPVVLGSFSTTLVGSLPARTQNVRLAVAALDGATLAPGEVLSFNAAVGPRSTERGYQSAPVILRESRQIQTGGGVCQLASTLFVAALLSGWWPEERWRHSSPVDYIPTGEDATISWGAKDLKLRNDLDQRCRVRAQIVGSTLTVWVEGERALDEEFDLETVELESDGSGGPAAGREIELYRVRRDQDRELERALVHRDLYPPTQVRAEAPRN